MAVYFNHHSAAEISHLDNETNQNRNESMANSVANHGNQHLSESYVPPSFDGQSRIQRHNHNDHHSYLNPLSND